MESSHDLARRVASLETEVRGIREEVQLNRRRYHDLSTKIAPILLEPEDIERHENELREIRASIDKMHGVWTALSVVGGILAAIATAAWAILSHFHIL